MFRINHQSIKKKTRIETESESEYKDETLEEQVGLGSDESQVTIGNTNAEGLFSWAETALSDGQIINVLTSNIVDSSDEEDDLEPGETSQTQFYKANQT